LLQGASIYTCTIRYCQCLNRIKHNSQGGDKLARSNYQFKKRQKELARKDKKDQKKQRKLDKNTIKPAENPDQPDPDQPDPH